MEKCYSISGEDFNLLSMSDVIDALSSEGNLTVGATYHSADAATPTASSFFNIENLMNDMTSSAEEEVGEWADFFPDVSDEEVAELEQIISKWLDEKVPVTFFKASNIKTHKIKIADLQRA
ncbi:MAG: hypothetical protein NT086_16315 [Proteobacteria bacterium]|nr:hypothetical protein [Pseudomonadota bacterium]